jgi:hypothetical protein
MVHGGLFFLSVGPMQLRKASTTANNEPKVRFAFALIAMVFIDANLIDPLTRYPLYLSVLVLYLVGLAVLELAILNTLRAISKVTASTARKCRHIKTSKYVLFAASALFVAAAALESVITTTALPGIGTLLSRIGVIILLVWYVGTLPLCGLFLVWDIRKKLSTSESIMLWGILASVPFMTIRLVFQVTHANGIDVVFNTTFTHHVSLAIAMEFAVVAVNLVACYINKRLEAKFDRCAILVISAIADIAEMSLLDGNLLNDEDSYWTTIAAIENIRIALNPSFVSRRVILAKVAKRACLEIMIGRGHRQSLFGRTVYCFDIEASQTEILRYVVTQIPGTLKNAEEGALVSTAVIAAIQKFRRLAAEARAEEAYQGQVDPGTEAELKAMVDASMKASAASTTETEVTTSRGSTINLRESTYISEQNGSTGSRALQVRSGNWAVQLREQSVLVELRDGPRVYEIEDVPDHQGAVTLYSPAVAARKTGANTNPFPRPAVTTYGS